MVFDGLKPLKSIEKQTLFLTLGHSKKNSDRACYTFSSFISLSNGSLLAAARRGNNKDSDLEGIDFFLQLMSKRVKAIGYEYVEINS